MIESKNIWDLGDKSFNGRERSSLFRARPDGRFEDVAYVFGVDGLEDGRGAVATDLDGDGAPDLAVANHEQPVRLFRHRPTTARWCRVMLRGRSAGNRDAVGATVVCRPRGGRVQAVPISAGFGFLAQGPPEACFGLGDATECDVTVRWPGGRVTTDVGLGAGTWEIDEVSGTVRKVG